ncbi:MAG: ATP-dependent Clp protease ATP-binding subunit [Alloprevotella sp.]|nr:ATP-dependent Clp protease ATP-binding subunit [Alloprevotella sp.]
MTYELSPALARILTRSKLEARRLGSVAVDTSCIALALLHSENECAFQILDMAETDIDTLRAKLEAGHRQAAERLMGSNSNVSTTMPSPTPPSIEEEGRLTIQLTGDGQRVMRLAFLEARLTGTANADGQHLLLAILRDKDNEARKALNELGVTYTKVAARLNMNSDVRSAFGFTTDDADDFPKEEKNGAGSQQTKTEKQTSDTPVTDNFGTDLTRLAAEGALDPVIGREAEILRIAQILSRRKKNNPVLIGLPGVGKSAVVEGLAGLIASRKVPRNLLGKRIVALDMASIVAGTQYRGQFEERLRRLMQELKDHREIILFIDEIHTIIGAGSAAGTLDAANILKPALARGEVQCIGATTTDEYRKSIEKDGALERRFQKIQLEPTSAEETLQILHNIRGRYEEHHNVSYTDAALEACVRLSERYITDRALPDKAIDALDEAGSRQHLNGLSAPKELEELEQRIAELKQQKSDAAKAQNYELAARLRDEVSNLGKELDRMNAEWLATQKENRQQVDAEEVAAVVSAMSGVPVQKLAQDESVRLRGMKQALQEKVIAQDDAITKLVRAITRNRLGLKGNDRPVGTFLFVGPTGVGKTYLVKCLAEWMFGRKDALIRIDMSEYGEKYSTSRLVGAPPGYVGYDEGGQLTEKVRRHPYSVILLDEIEKAHPDVFNMLLQVMDEGRMTDGNGVTVDFRNTIIIMTSNSGTRQLKDFGAGIGFDTQSREMDGKAAEGIVRKALQRQFSPEFLNRLDDIIMFQPLGEKDAMRIADLELAELQKRLDNMQLTIELAPEAKQLIVKDGFNAQYGARSLKRAIQTHVEDKICELVMDAPEAADSPHTVRFSISGKTLKAEWA